MATEPTITRSINDTNQIKRAVEALRQVDEFAKRPLMTDEGYRITARLVMAALVRGAIEDQRESEWVPWREGTVRADGRS